jgi:hypothetical protein
MRGFVMLKTSFTVEDVLFAYTKTPATAKSIAAKYGVHTMIIGLILKTNLDYATFEKLKIQKLSHGHVKSNLMRYRQEHGL